eukprot:6621425-Prymnesium_polylepis.1
MSSYWSGTIRSNLQRLCRSTQVRAAARQNRSAAFCVRVGARGSKRNRSKGNIQQVAMGK